jgi:hypothetical protein
MVGVMESRQASFHRLPSRLHLSCTLTWGASFRTVGFELVELEQWQYSILRRFTSPRFVDGDGSPDVTRPFLFLYIMAVSIPVSLSPLSVHQPSGLSLRAAQPHRH